MTKIPYIRISPVTLVCPHCGANPGSACKMLRGEVELIHVERILAAAANDIVAKKKLSETLYVKSGKRKLKKVLNHLARSAANAEEKWR